VLYSSHLSPSLLGQLGATTVRQVESGVPETAPLLSYKEESNALSPTAPSPELSFATPAFQLTAFGQKKTEDGEKEEKRKKIKSLQLLIFLL